MDTEMQAIFDQTMREEETRGKISKRLYRTAKDLLLSADVLLDVSRLPTSVQIRIAEVRAAVMLWEETYPNTEEEKAPPKQKFQKTKRNRGATKRGRRGIGAFSAI